MPKPFVTIEMDRPRKVRFSMNAICEFELASGKPLTAMVDTELGMRDVRALLYAGLKDADRLITPEKAGTIMDDVTERDGQEGLQQLITALTLALTGSISGGEAPKETGP